ncbi:glycosyltransferase [Candidatus Uhrbacteria bacterium]|nr:glycosyltransferase [Candidatus Uhrbacteria bacterium]
MKQETGKQLSNKQNTGDPKVTFITVCYKTPNLIRLLLKGFESAGIKFSYEYYLVDNAPGDGTGKMVRELNPWVNVIETPKNVGFGAGNNHALRRARGEYIMLVNPDLVIFPGELEKLVDFLDGHPDIGLVGPKLLNPDRTCQNSCYRFPGPLIPVYRRTPLGLTPWGKRAIRHYLMHQELQRDTAMEVDALMGSALMLRRRVIDEIGYFDEKFFMYFEEVDICRRAWKYNWRVVYVPQAQLVHYHARESLIRRPWQIITHKPTRHHIASAVYYFWKYRGAQNPHNEKRPVL